MRLVWRAIAVGAGTMVAALIATMATLVAIAPMVMAAAAVFDPLAPVLFIALMSSIFGRR